MNTQWRPAGTHSGVPAIGDVLAREYSAWEILDITTTSEDHSITLKVKKLFGPHEHSKGTITARGFAAKRMEIYPHGRVPLCSCCAAPFPCRDSDAELIAAQAAALMEKRMARAGVPGICYGCGEVITNRQESLTYPADEGNVQLPGYPAPRFHMRSQCGNARWYYAQDRAKQLPDKLAIDPDYAREERLGL